MNDGQRGDHCTDVTELLAVAQCVQVLEHTERIGLRHCGESHTCAPITISQLQSLDFRSWTDVTLPCLLLDEESS